MGRSSLRLLLELMQDTGQPPAAADHRAGARRAPQHRAAAQAARRGGSARLALLSRGSRWSRGLADHETGRR